MPSANFLVDAHKNCKDIIQEFFGAYCLPPYIILLCSSAQKVYKSHLKKNSVQRNDYSHFLENSWQRMSSE